MTQPIIQEIEGDINTGHFYIKTTEDNRKRVLRHSERFGYYLETKKFFKKLNNIQDIKRIENFIGKK